MITFKEFMAENTRARKLKITGMDSAQYETPFPTEHIANDMSLLYLYIKGRLKTAPVQKVRVDSLIAIQHLVDRSGVNRYKKKLHDPILVARINGKNYIMDGTHRATVAWAKREVEIDAHFLEFKGLNLNHQKTTLTHDEWEAMVDKAQVT